MESLLVTGRVRSIGVSNFSIKNLETLLGTATVVPAVNQVEMHLCLPDEALKRYCEDKGIIVTAYSPLGEQSTHRLYLVSNKRMHCYKVARRSLTENLFFWTTQTFHASRGATKRRRVK